MQPHRGTTVLVLGIVSIFCCGVILGPIAAVLGNSDLQAMRAGRMDPTGEGTTRAGMICGIIGFVLNVVMLILNFTVFRGQMLSRP